MSDHQTRNLKNRTNQRNSVVLAKRSRRQLAPFVKRGRHAENNLQYSYEPPENWYEPSTCANTYEIIVQPPGNGFRHVVTAEEVRHRLSLLPKLMLAGLDRIQLSEMTRKKRRYPCYGMQWGTTLYLYPVEVGLVECFTRPPKPAQLVEAKMYGGQWIEEPGQWRLVWTEKAIKDFYLNNVLIHELGHLLDDRNSSYVDRERYAEWFAIQYGYNCEHRTAKPGKKKIQRRHHSAR